MTRSRPLSALIRVALPLLLAGCGGGGLGLGITDGGPVGTGIVASVSGNVVTVEDFDTAEATGLEATAATEELEPTQSIEGIAVSLVEFPDLETSTDVDGNFALEGEFDGALTLRFRTPDFEADQPIDVPSGGTVVLSDIEVEMDGATADAKRQLDLRGRVESTDCAAGVFEIETRNGDRFDVLVDEQTRFTRDGDDVAGCEELRARDEVSIDSLPVDVAAREVTAFAVEIDPDDSAPKPRERRIAFSGFIGVVDCEQDRLAVSDGETIVRIFLPSDVQITDRSGTEISCEALTLGDRVTGLAVLDTRRPGIVLAEELQLSGRIGPGQRLEIRGDVLAANCDTGVLRVSNDGAIVVVRLLPDTQIDKPRNFSCDTLFDRPYRIRGQGLVSDDVSGAIDAIRVSFTKIKSPR